MVINRTILFLLIIATFCGCSGLEKTEREKIRKRNCKGEAIYRNQGDIFYPIENPQLVVRSPYPWESESNLPRLTKEFFRCKGSSQNPPLLDTEDGTQANFLSDCEGGVRHGLPIIHGKEGVYPILIDLLNYIQKKTGKRVVITSGHRCPVHNTYVDAAKANRTSKHQVGAEVDFYVQGMEDRPLEIVGLLMQYYQETASYQNQKDYQAFIRDARTDSDSIQPWMNKEIYIKLFQKGEGRNFDNRHPHPYLSVQVRYDRLKNERVVYDWGRANKSYSKCW